MPFPPPKEMKPGPEGGAGVGGPPAADGFPTFESIVRTHHFTGRPGPPGPAGPCDPAPGAATLPPRPI